jgi:hypothetical protein
MDLLTRAVAISSPARFDAIIICPWGCSCTGCAWCELVCRPQCAVVLRGRWPGPATDRVEWLDMEQ